MNTARMKWFAMVFFILTGFVIPPAVVAKDAALPLTATSSKTASAWPDKALLAYIQQSNQPETYFLQQLTVRQNELEKPVYVQTGVEEKRRQLSKRPVLCPASGSAPFARVIEYTARIDRSQSIGIDFLLFRISAMAGGKIKKSAPKHLYVYLKPRYTEEHVLLLRDGKFHFDLPVPEPCCEVSFQVRSGDERHEVRLFLINEKKPFTLETE